MNKWKELLVAAIATLVVDVARGAALAADLHAAPRPETAAENTESAVDYLRRLAVLGMIRATFNVIATEDIEAVLERAANAFGAGGPSEFDVARLDRDLLAEGSYYLVSLRYLAESGGAAWPSDRPEIAYTNDALVTLDSLQDRLIDAVNEEADPLPIFKEAQRILALSEGFLAIPVEMDRFKDRDAMVEQVLANHGPTART